MERNTNIMRLFLIIMTLIFGVGSYLVITGSLLPFIVADFPIGITITNNIIGIISILFSLGMVLIATKIETE